MREPSLPVLSLWSDRPGASMDGLPEQIERLEGIADSPAAALAKAGALRPGRDVLLCVAGAHWPADAWSRLHSAWCESPDTSVLSPLSAALLPALPECDAETIAALCWTHGEHASFAVDGFAPGCSLWRAEAVAALTATSTAPPLCPQRARLLPCVWVGAAAAAMPEPLHHLAIDLLQEKLLASSGDVVPRLRRGQPVLLHVLHNWGGGIERFARDLATADTQRQHLFLVASGELHWPPFGRFLGLHHDLDQPPLRRWQLAEPIEDTAIRNQEVAQLLAQIGADWGVGAVLVSSLIGHSLDVLRTGLPTAFCAHDAYPFWPLLHQLPEGAADAIADETLAASISGSQPTFLFPHQDPRRWRNLRGETLAALRAAEATMVTPSESARQRMLRLVPELAAFSWQVIAHGSPAIDAPLAWAPQSERPLRVLIPGHLSGGKGETLLDQLLPQLPANVELIALGSGNAAADKYAGDPRLQIQARYEHAQLRDRVEALQPDIAMLPSTVPETWSYTLSEMTALGLPCLCSRLGALAERIESSGYGWLVAADAQSFAAMLTELAADREKVRAMRARPRPRLPSLEAMTDAWRIACPAQARTPRLAAAEPDRSARMGPEISERRARVESAAAEQMRQSLQMELGLANTDRQQLQEAALASETAQHAYRTLIASNEQALRERETELSALQQQLLEAQQLHAQVEQRHTTLQESHDELQRGHAEAARQIAEMAQRQRALEQQQIAIGQQRDDLAAREDELSAALTKSYVYYEQDTRDLACQRDQALAMRDANDAQLALIQRSRSWRMTRPLRFLSRWLRERTLTLQYRLRRMSSTLTRATRSLRTRGLVQSWRRLRQNLDHRTELRRLQLPDAASPLAVDAVALQLPRSPTPRASIVIPVFNQIDYTLRCLRSLADSGDATTIEIIVVDDASSDAGAQWLPAISGLRYQRNTVNLGFIGSCNAGAANANGEFLVFLNNDTVVQPGWLDALLSTFESHPDTGLVGAKLVYPDGRLQEAGGILFSDASGWNYGRFNDPADPRYNFVRDVDYCSGAAIALRRALFAQLGGFDAHYAPAYYEDADLAMRVRECGLTVRYQPASVVIHYEGITSGTDLTQGVKSYQVTNQKKFLARWATVLAKDHPAPTLAADIDRAARHRYRRRVLVLDACTPMPDRDAGSLRMFEILQLLAQENCASSFFAENHHHDGAYTASLQQLGVEAWWHPWLDDVPRWLGQHGARFDLIIASRHYVLAPLLPLLRRYAPQARIVFDTVDLHFLREEREAQQGGNDAQAPQRTRDAELQLARQCDVTWVVSPFEKQLLAELVPDVEVQIVSTIHEVQADTAGFDERRDLIFVGGFRHPPNVDAATWLVEEIFPLVHRQRPDIHLHIVGGDAPPAIQALGERDGVVFRGHVPDLDALSARMRLSVAPLRYGAGVKGKINFSLARGLPVVASSSAIEGMHLIDGEDVLVADDAATFAATILRLYEDEALWQHLRAGGIANTTRHFSRDTARRAILPLLASLP